MATLLSYASSGGEQGRCDAKCYNATSPHCDCICGGMNHGKGEDVAVAQTSALAQSWIDRYRSEHPDEACTFDCPVVQGRLFAGAA